jgi:hypothetical protein
MAVSGLVTVQMQEVWMSQSGWWNLQSIPALIHAASSCQDQTGVGVLYPLLHLAPELATPS